MDFDTWLKACKKFAAERGLSLPDPMDEEQAFFWQNQYDNQMMPTEAVHYYQQTLGEGG